MDPFGYHDDVRLWDALKRAYLVEDRKGSVDGTEESLTANAGKRFSLDSPIEDEGGNLSIGQVGWLCCAAYRVSIEWHYLSSVRSCHWPARS